LSRLNSPEPFATLRFTTGKEPVKMKIHIALLMPYRISDVKNLLSKEDIYDWPAYTAFNKEVYDIYKEIKDNLENNIEYKTGKKIFISLN